jgi:putative ABC transport system ATP-binding protein
MMASKCRSIGYPDWEGMIELSQVALKLGSAAGEVNILNGVDLSIAAGETVGLVGPSGSGKTSLMLLLAGLESATAGQISINGAQISGMSEDALALFRRRNIGIVFQSFHLIPTMTATENVAVPLELAGIEDPFGIASRALEDVGLGHRLTHYPSQLSGGEQQRVALARAIAPRPKLLLADEPTGNLDMDTGSRIIELLFALREQVGATLLLITHDPALAKRCDRTLRMADGRIVSDGRLAA